MVIGLMEVHVEPWACRVHSVNVMGEMGDKRRVGMNVNVVDGNIAMRSNRYGGYLKEKGHMV